MVSCLLPLATLIVLFIGLFLLTDPIPWSVSDEEVSNNWSYLVQIAPQVTILEGSAASAPSQPSCHLFNCLDIYKCATHHNQLSVYIYPPTSYQDQDGNHLAPLSKEFNDMLQSVYESHFYTSDPSSACIFLPSVDILNLRYRDLTTLSMILGSLDYWDQGRNHLFLNMLSPTDKSLTLPIGKAFLASSDPSLIRPGYDISIPVLPPTHLVVTHTDRTYLLIAWSYNLPLNLANILPNNRDGVIILTSDIRHYPTELFKSSFCLVNLQGEHNPLLLLTYCLSSGTIPAIISSSSSNLPFSSLIDWPSLSVSWRSETPGLLAHLTSISPLTIGQMRSTVASVYNQHFSSPSAVILSVLEVLNHKLFPQSNHVGNKWNLGFSNPLSLPVLPPADDGFTAVILTYNRLQSLFQVISKISETPSLSRIVVVWNHQSVGPPPVDEWPRITKPLKVIQTRDNKLSNRFYPYDEIETECVLSLDDDISMLTSDELEFGYQVWREFPDRVVGFPSRTHQYHSLTDTFSYESEWTNDISMILTGVSFYHKNWHYLFSAAPSPAGQLIKTWVDEHMNCEDIAFNLMVSNITGKSPIKVGPRKKFACSTPSCENTGMLSSAVGHLEERSACLDIFIKIYREGGGKFTGPLVPVEFRADPVLFKENYSDRLKLYNDIGSL